MISRPISMDPVLLGSLAESMTVESFERFNFAISVIRQKIWPKPFDLILTLLPLACDYGLALRIYLLLKSLNRPKSAKQSGQGLERGLFLHEIDFYILGPR